MREEFSQFSWFNGDSVAERAHANTLKDVCVCVYMYLKVFDCVC